LEAEILAMMTDTLQWKRLVKVDGRNRKTYADVATPILGYWEEKQTQRLNADGTWTAIGGFFYCGGAFDVQTVDEVTMPDGTKPSIAFVVTYRDENGPYGTVITLGR
jgi:hypothetical protein